MAAAWPPPTTVAAHATGLVHLAAGDPRAALVMLRRAWRGWHHLEAPYEAARSRMQSRSPAAPLDDVNGADLEFARREGGIRNAGAIPDAAAVTRTSGGEQRPGGLTPRELEVLAPLAKGSTRTNTASPDGRPK